MNQGRNMNQTEKSIKHWPKNERPREKLFKLGEKSLSDAEILAILLRTGSQHLSAVDLARQMLNRYGSLSALLNADAQQLLKEPCLGPAKVASLKAAQELAQRQLQEPLIKQPSIQSSKAAKEYLRLRYKGLQQEVFSCLFLDAQFALIKVEDLFFGTVNQSHVYPREVVKQCLKYNASAVIFSHNHPSGIAEPSQADIAITQQLRDALKNIDIEVVDHLIVGDTVFSFADKGYL